MKASISVEKLILPTYLEPAAEELPMFAENRVHQRSSGTDPVSISAYLTETEYYLTADIDFAQWMN